MKKNENTSIYNKTGFIFYKSCKKWKKWKNNDYLNNSIIKREWLSKRKINKK